MIKEEEKYLLKELAGGSRQAFECLFICWHPRLVSFLTHLLADEDAAYDYAQDVFFDIWTQKEKFAQVESFGAYLFQMARFKVYNHYDKVAVKGRFKNDVMVREAEGTAPSGESRLYASEMETQIWKAVREMPAKRRQIFIMSRSLGFTNEEIAQKLGINKRTVENQITNVLAVLRNLVKVIIALCVSGLLNYK